MWSCGQYELPVMGQTSNQFISNGDLIFIECPTFSQSQMDSRSKYFRF